MNVKDDNHALRVEAIAGLLESTTRDEQAAAVLVVPELHPVVVIVVELQMPSGDVIVEPRESTGQVTKTFEAVIVEHGIVDVVNVLSPVQATLGTRLVVQSIRVTLLVSVTVEQKPSKTVKVCCVQELEKLGKD